MIKFPPHTLAHFAINADDVDRARAFYTAVFDWKFHAWGPPGFFQIEAPGSPVIGALQGRRELASGQRMIGFECTFAVESIDTVAAAVAANGGKILLDRSVIPGVGTLMFFADPDGNVFGAMQYETAP
jgi:predicted enzyme related to lactoylglutathione lyase